jgi:hypothetical protein
MSIKDEQHGKNPERFKFPLKFKEWINFYAQKSSELNGLRSLIGSLER